MLRTTDEALDPVLRGELERILGSDGVVTDPSEIACAQVDVWWITRYEISRGDRLPRCQALVFPHTTAEVAAVVRLCNDRGVPVISAAAAQGTRAESSPFGAGSSSIRSAWTGSSS